MGWRDHLSENQEMVLPWVGGRRVFHQGRIWRVEGRLPLEFGWYRFQTSGGRTATVIERSERDPDYEQGLHLIRGYLAGDRLIPDTARVDPDPRRMAIQTRPVFLIDMGLPRFARVGVVEIPTETDKVLLYTRLEFPTNVDADVEEAYQDRKDSVSHIPGVTPALDLTFRWISFQRVEAERREAEEETRRLEEIRRLEAEEKMREAMKDAGTAVGRRALAKIDFKAAARKALELSGAELLDTRQQGHNEMVVQYRYMNRRLECVVHRETLRIIDAGVCLENHQTGKKWDTHFTLESLPPVIGEAIRLGVLVVWRHI